MKIVLKAKQKNLINFMSFFSCFCKKRLLRNTNDFAISSTTVLRYYISCKRIRVKSDIDPVYVRQPLVP